MRLRVPYFKQNLSYICGPVTLQMLFAYFGIRKSREELIKECVDAFSKLIKNGYSLEKAIAILEQESIKKWKKTVDRLVDVRKSKKVKISMKKVLLKLLGKD